MPHMTHTLLVLTLFVLLAALLYARALQKILAYEKEQADKCFASWRHTTHSFDAMAAKATKLIGEKANAEARIRSLETELLRKQARARS